MRYLNYCLLLLLPLVLACSRKDYDISEGLNPEMTLFEKEIRLPLGSIGPFTVNDMFDKLGDMPGLGEFLAQYISMGKDGGITVTDTGNIFSANVYEVEKELKDPGVASEWNAGEQTGYVAGIMGTLGFLGLTVVKQKFVITATNPLKESVPVTSHSTYKGDGFSGPIEGMDSFTLPRRSTEELVSQTLPDNVVSPISSLELSDLTFSLPANPTSLIHDKESKVFFSFDYNYTGNLAVGEKFHFMLASFSPGEVKLEIGKYKLKQCEITLELENTLPMKASIGKFAAYSLTEKGVKDENLLITPDISIAGGSPEHPATTKFTLCIEAKEGTIPDIGEIRFDLDLAAQPGLGAVALTSKEGLYIKNASAILSGGITIPLELE